MLECVINVSEGCRADVLTALAGAAGNALLDVHSDREHNRSVFTLGGPDVQEAARSLTAVAITSIDITKHEGAHPRFGAVDVVPFVPLYDGERQMGDATRARDAFARWLGATYDVPCFLYGAERSLPEVRRHAFGGWAPDFGPAAPHVTAGATAVGARPLLLAYNLWLEGGTLEAARRIARSLRSPSVRSIGLDLGGHYQVSCNLIAPLVTGPGAVFDAVAREGAIARAELVGLCPASVLEREPRSRWARLDLDEERTIEARLRRAGFEVGKI